MTAICSANLCILGWTSTRPAESLSGIVHEQLTPRSSVFPRFDISIVTYPLAGCDERWALMDYACASLRSCLSHWMQCLFRVFWMCYLQPLLSFWTLTRKLKEKESGGFPGFRNPGSRSTLKGICRKKSVKGEFQKNLFREKVESESCYL